MDRLKLQTEHGRITGHGPANDNRSGYVMATYVFLGEQPALGGRRAQ